MIDLLISSDGTIDRKSLAEGAYPTIVSKEHIPVFAVDPDIFTPF